MDFTSPARVGQLFFALIIRIVIRKGVRYFPAVGAYNDKAWCYFLGINDATLRKYLDDNDVPYKVIAKERWMTPDEFWKSIPYEGDKKKGLGKCPSEPTVKGRSTKRKTANGE